MALRHVLRMMDAATNAFLNDRSGRAETRPPKAARTSPDRRTAKPGDRMKPRADTPAVAGVECKFVIANAA